MEQMENFLKVNFLPIWHHILVLMDSSELNYKGMFRDEAVELWNKFGKIGFETNTVLTYTLVSELTSLSIETVRRQVMRLQNNNWVHYSKKKEYYSNLVKTIIIF